MAQGQLSPVQEKDAGRLLGRQVSKKRIWIKTKDCMSSTWWPSGVSSGDQGLGQVGGVLCQGTSRDFQGESMGAGGAGPAEGSLGGRINTEASGTWVLVKSWQGASHPGGCYRARRAEEEAPPAEAGLSSREGRGPRRRPQRGPGIWPSNREASGVNGGVRSQAEELGHEGRRHVRPQ